MVDELGTKSTKWRWCGCYFKLVVKGGGRLLGSEASHLPATFQIQVLPLTSSCCCIGSAVFVGSQFQFWSFSLDSACSPHACVGFLWVSSRLPRVQRMSVELIGDSKLTLSGCIDSDLVFLQFCYIPQPRNDQNRNMTMAHKISVCCQEPNSDLLCQTPDV